MDLPIDELLTVRARELLAPGRQLAAWCAAHGMSLRSLAAELGVNHSQLWRVANGHDRGAPIARTILERTGVQL